MHTHDQRKFPFYFELQKMTLKTKNIPQMFFHTDRSLKNPTGEIKVFNIASVIILCTVHLKRR